MSEQARTEASCGPQHGSGGPWYPLRKWWRPSRPFNQDVGLPPFLEPGDPWWMNVDWLQRSLAAAAWPAFAAAPLFVPYISGSMHGPGQKTSQEPSTWRVSLDVAHFAPAEVSLSVKDGFLEVGGRHEERRDEHGFIARCFTRKYRLPAEIDATQITSTLSVDGILTVEAPVPGAVVPAAIIIPIKVEVEAAEEEKDKHEEEETPETEAESSREPEAPESLAAPDPVVEEEDSPAEVRGDQAQPGSATVGPQQQDKRKEQEVEDSPAEVHGDQAQPGSATPGPQQSDERREQEEETHEQPAGESHPSAPADGSGTESLQDSSKQDEALGSQEGPDTEAPKQPEHKEPAVGGEIQVMPGSAEEITQPEEPELGTSPLSKVPSQDPEAPETKPEHTE